MRIALFTDTYLPDINGVVSSVELLRKKLEERGHEVYVVSTYPGIFKVKKEGRIIRLPGLELKSLYGYKAASPGHLLMLEELRELQLDLIHVHTEFGVGIFASMAAHLLHIPLVRTYHTTYEDYTHYVTPIESETFEQIARNVIIKLSKSIGEDCIRLISPSRKTADMLKGYGVKTPIDIIPTGVELQRFRPTEGDAQLRQQVRQQIGIREEEKMLLFVGRIAEEKSIDLLIDTAAEMVQQQLPVRLVIVGGGPQLEELQQKAQELALQEKVSFLGKKPFDEVPAFYKAADAFVSASTSETQGMTYVEAMATGLPVLARYDEVLEDLVSEGENGYFFRDQDELAQKVKALLQLDERSLQQMKEKALATAQEYDADSFGEKVEKLYLQAIEDYHASYTITKISLKNDYVALKLHKGENEEETLLVSLDTFYEEGLRKDQRLPEAAYQELKRKEAFAKAYRACLRKIASHDRTVQQIRTFLKEEGELEPQEQEAVIQKLQERGILNDRTYVLNKMDSFRTSLLSKKQFERKLRTEGIGQELIEELLQADPDDEKVRARIQAEKIQNTIHNKSLAVKKKMIVQKLITKGFDADTAQEALRDLDFSQEEFSENENLSREAAKAAKRLERKYSGTDLRNRVYHALASKGYKTEAIYAALNEMEWKS